MNNRQWVHEKPHCTDKSWILRFLFFSSSRSFYLPLPVPFLSLFPSFSWPLSHSFHVPIPVLSIYPFRFSTYAYLPILTSPASLSITPPYPFYPFFAYALSLAHFLRSSSAVYCAIWLHRFIFSSLPLLIVASSPYRHRSRSSPFHRHFLSFPSPPPLLLVAASSPSSRRLLSLLPLSLPCTIWAWEWAHCWLE